LHINIFKKVQPFTMTSPERIYSLMEAVKYICRHKIEGDIVECGVWKGGSMLAVAETLVNQKISDKQLLLYDTFEGMPEPTEHDQDFTGNNAHAILNKNQNKEENLVWAYSPLDAVQKTLSLSSYDKKNIRYIVGKVEDTIPQDIPEKIALLRLDTDWYESTKHELIHLFPRLQKGGVLIIDDYGFWKGARKAVDEYFAENNIPILLNTIDDTGRIAKKL
ncbi:MAG: TylF/MycF/NovP-related O-methyltransferase, partial [Ferruginibacter sp.]